jgi:hypothetical protein
MHRMFWNCCPPLGACLTLLFTSLRLCGDPIPFEAFARFERLEGGNPLFVVDAPNWAAAAHTIVVDETVHYFWSMRDGRNFWDLRHSTAPTADLTSITHDPRNPILRPPAHGMDSKSVEYPNPFFNPLDDRFYMYYLVKENDRGRPTPKQTGLLVSNGDLGEWKRVSDRPVISAVHDHELTVAGHTATAIVGDKIHIIYTGLKSYRHNPTVCHATASLKDPAKVTKNPRNPVFSGSGQPWDAEGVREAEIFVGPEYFHVFYGGRGADHVFQIGHVRTKDFETFEANPYNPILTTNEDPTAWDADGLLTPHVFQIGEFYYMLYAGLKGEGWHNGHCLSGLARAPAWKGNKGTSAAF